MVSFEGQVEYGLLLTIPDNKVTSVRSVRSDKAIVFLGISGLSVFAGVFVFPPTAWKR